MRKILLSLITVVLVNCNAIGGDEYEITGKLLNPSAKSIYLEKISHTEIKMIDSSNITNGNFSLKGPIEGLGLYRLRIITNADNQNGISWFLTLNKKEKITAQFDEKTPIVYTITGSEQQQEFQSLIKNMAAQQAEMMQLYQQYNTLSKQNPDSKEAQDIAAQINSKNQGINNYITGVIQNSKNLMTKYYLYSMMLQQYQNQPLPDQLIQDIKLFSEKLKTEMPNTLYASDFQGIVTNIENQKLMEAAKARLDAGAIAPDVELVKDDGTKVNLSSFRGKVVLMDFWASWCRPCRMENPNVVAAYKKYKNKGFVVLSISQDQDLNKWKAAIAQDGLEWNTHFADIKTGNQASRTYEVSYIPKTYLLSKDGKIIASDLRGPALDAELEKLFK